jgi:AbrB family looped-hinge helix DNA binding protein
MKKRPKVKGVCQGPKVMSSTVMGERGQLVVPKEVRECYDLKAGDKFFVFGHGDGPIILVPTNQMLDMMDHLNAKIGELMKDQA